MPSISTGFRHIIKNKKTIASVLKIISFIFYAWNDALSKQLSTQGPIAMSTHSIIFYQYFITACLLLPFYLTKTMRSHQKIIAPHYHMIRVILCTVAILLLNQSFKKMPLFYALGFNLLSPFMTVAFALVCFKEKLSAHKIKALLLSVCTYLILVQSQKGHAQNTLTLFECLKPTIALLCFQANTIVTKKLTMLKESNINLTLILFIAIPIVLLPFELSNLEIASGKQYLLLGHMAVNGAIATFALHQAISMAELTFLLPFGFLKYGIITVFGYLYFYEIPGYGHSIGIILAMISLYYLHQNEKKMASTQKIIASQ